MNLTASLAVDLLLLLLAANGTPVLAKRLLHERWNWPLDGGLLFLDGRPLLGRSKTWRGLVTAVGVTTLMAWGLGYAPWVGAVFAVASLLGDMISSFVKRRLDVPSSGRALGLDQLPEALLPLLVLHGVFHLDALSMAVMVVAFTVGSLLLSRVMFHFGVREQPY